MSESQSHSFVNPEVANAITPRLSSIESQDREKPLVRAIKIKNAIYETANELGMHPRIILKELRLSRVQTTEQALGIEAERVSKYAYVGDIHGFTTQKQAEIENILFTGNFEQVFFMGDIGGSAKLTRLQRLFYQGGNSGDDNLMWNRYKALAKEAQEAGREVDDATILQELRQGYINLASYERVLADPSLTEEQAREQVQALPDKDVVEGIRWTVKHKHFGHYVSDLSETAIESLAGEVRENYERFGNFARRLLDETGAEVVALEGNWDVRLPFDFEKNTPDPVALPIEQRRLYGANVLRAMGVNFVTGISTVETDNAMHVLVPFEPLTKPMDQDQLDSLKANVAKARAASKTVTIVAHAVPSWERHNNLTPTNEGKVTAQNLMELIGVLNADEIVYGHEHFIRKDQNTTLMPADTKYRIITEDGITQALGDESLIELDQASDGTIASPVPMADQLSVSRIGVSEKLKDMRFNSNVIRGRGGKASPVKIDRSVGEIRNF